MKIKAIYDNGGQTFDRLICQTSPASEEDARPGSPYLRSVMEANAELIVRAVNMHEELLEIVKILATQFEASPNKGQVYVGYELVKRAMASIAKAEGKGE
jgi:hypothetical protein